MKSVFLLLLIPLMAVTVYPQTQFRLEGKTDFCVTRKSAGVAYDLNQPELLDIRDCRACQETRECVDLWVRDYVVAIMPYNPSSVREEIHSALAWYFEPAINCQRPETGRDDLSRWTPQAVQLPCKEIKKRGA